jgi:uncharacterized iron-regulated protein
MNKIPLVVMAWLCVAWMSVCGGCAAGPRGGEVAGPPLAEQARAVRVFRGSDGSAASWESLIADTSVADAVVIGENHGHVLGLAFAAELWADVLSRRDRAVLSMEFFNRDEQSKVDDYLSGLWDEAAFRQGTGRADDVRYPPGHRAMVEAAKAAGRPVIASNAPRTYVRTASRASYDKLASLTEDQRRLFRVPDELPAGRYRADFDALMSDPLMASHGGTTEPETPEALRKRLDSRFRSQSLWDWTMAESVTRGIDRGGSPVVHVVGRFHSDFDGGLVQALVKLRSGTRVVTISVVDAWSESLREEDRGRADFVAYVGDEEQPGM